MRLFVAICFSDETRNALSSAVDALRAQWQGHFSPAENLHLTLAFLGEVDHADAALSAIQKVKSPSFSLQFDRIGQFGNLYWAGIRENDALRALQAQLMAHLKAAGFSFEEREFIPHITLARRYAPSVDFSPAAVEQILTKIEEPVREIALMRSFPQESGAHYETLAVYELSEK